MAAEEPILNADTIMGAIDCIYRDAGWRSLHPAAVSMLKELISDVVAERDTLARVRAALAEIDRIVNSGDYHDATARYMTFKILAALAAPPKRPI
jgi:hypothetical protein